MLIMAGVFSFISTYLYNQKIPKFIAYLSTAYFALSPLHATYSVTIWKDIIFGVIVALQLICIIKMVEEPKNKKYIFTFTILTILTTLFRNNGIYSFIIFLPFLIFYYLKNKIMSKEIIISVIFIFGSYFAITGPLYQYLNVAKSPVTESLSIPLNQMARVWYLDGDLNSKEIKYLNSIMDTTLIKEKYSQTLADPIKNITNPSEIDKNKFEFIKNWMSIMSKNLSIYIDSFMIETSGFWNVNLYDIPIVAPQKIEPFSSKYNIKNHNFLPSFADKYFTATRDNKTLFLQLFYSASLMFYFLIISFILNYYKKNYKYWLAYIPLIAIWLTIMIATPIYTSARYVYPLFTCLPIYLSLPFFKSELSKPNSKK